MISSDLIRLRKSLESDLKTPPPQVSFLKVKLLLEYFFCTENIFSLQVWSLAFIDSPPSIFGLQKLPGKGPHFKS